jgi:hypothetical protein
METHTALERDPGPACWAGVYSNADASLDRRQEALQRLIEGYRAELESGCPLPPGGWGNTLTRLLQRQVENVARMTTRGSTATERNEFAADAIRLICAPRETKPPRICKYEPWAGPLEPWLSQVLNRCWIDQCRKQRAQLPLREAALVPGRIDAPSLFAEPFGSRDLHCLERWNVQDRIKLLGLSGLFVKVPNDCWESWVVEYEAARGFALDRPFPSLGVRSLDSHSERKGPLGLALKIPTNTLDVYWYRKKWLLRDLECLQDEYYRGSG